jgi:hypothetical protein
MKLKEGPRTPLSTSFPPEPAASKPYSVYQILS